MTHLIAQHRCRICDSPDIQPLIDFGERPITKRLLDFVPPQHEYLHPLTLSICRKCGFVQIFDEVPPQELYTNYNLHSAWKAQPHLLDEIQALCHIGALGSDSFVVEIGCNDGSALKTVNEIGVRSSLGIEPSQDVAQLAKAGGLNVINAYFDADLAKNVISRHGQADVVICRQVLEHVSGLASFMEGVGEIVKDGGHILFEVPDFAVPLAHGDVSAIWEEHVNYFTENSLSFLLRKSGFTIITTKRYDFSGGALCLIGKKTGGEAFSEAHSLTNEYDVNSKFNGRVDLYKKYLSSKLKSKGADDVAIYGAGNRSAIVLNYFLREYVDFVVDDQSEKQNLYMPLSHLPIYPSSELIKRNVKLCLLAVNSENDAAVIARHKEYLEKGGEFISILSPNDNLQNFDRVKP